MDKREDIVVISHQSLSKTHQRVLSIELNRLEMNAVALVVERRTPEENEEYDLLLRREEWRRIGEEMNWFELDDN